MEIYCSSFPCHHQFPLLISLSWMAILLRLLKEKGFNSSSSSQSLVLSVQAEPTFNMYVQLCFDAALLSSVYVFADVYPCAVPQSQAAAEAGLHDPFHSLTNSFALNLLPTRVLYCPVPILIILFRSRRTCGLALTMSPTSALLLTGSLPTGNCSMLCWTSYFALTDTLAKIWWSGSSKSCALTTFPYDRPDFALLAFFWTALSCVCSVLMMKL